MNAPSAAEREREYAKRVLLRVAASVRHEFKSDAAARYIERTADEVYGTDKS